MPQIETPGHVSILNEANRLTDVLSFPFVWIKVLSVGEAHFFDWSREVTSYSPQVKPLFTPLCFILSLSPLAFWRRHLLCSPVCTLVPFWIHIAGFFFFVSLNICILQFPPQNSSVFYWESWPQGSYPIYPLPQSTELHRDSLSELTDPTVCTAVSRWRSSLLLSFIWQKWAYESTPFLHCFNGTVQPAPF